MLRAWKMRQGGWLLVLAALLLWHASKVRRMQAASTHTSTKQLLLVVSSNGTNLSVVQGVLQAAGVPVVRAGAGPILGSAVLAQPFNGTLLELQHAAKAVSGVHILHVVQDVRQVLYEALQEAEQNGQGNERIADGTLVHGLAGSWSAYNMAVREWATTQGLGLARRYSIARVEDMCNTAYQDEAAEAMLHNAGLQSPAGAAAPLAPLCQPGGTWQTGLASAASPHLDAAITAADASARAALLAFGYQPTTGLGLPAWLNATSALSEVRSVADSMSATATNASDRQQPTPTAIVTFVSDGYEPILNNWLSWVKHAGVDVSNVVVVGSPERAGLVRQKIRYRGVRVVALGPLEPDSTAPDTSFELGLKAEPKRHARARVWLARIRVLYEFVSRGVPVIMSDLDAVWLRNAQSDILSKASGLSRGFDLVMSPGFFPFDVHKQMGVVGCMGFLYANATAAATSVLGMMLLEKLHQLSLQEVKFYNDQRVLNEQLLRANIALNVTARPEQGQTTDDVMGVQLSTAPGRLRVLYLSAQHYARVCTNSSMPASAIVVHCQAHNSGAAKAAFLSNLGLWRDGQEEELQVTS